MGQQLVKSEKEISACEREGVEHVNNVKKLAKVCGMTASGGQLQPVEWRRIMKEKPGVLLDNNLMKTAEAWYNVAKAIHREQWVKEEVQQGKLTAYVYHKCTNKNEPLCMLAENIQPPPYGNCNTCHSTEPHLPSHTTLLPILPPLAQHTPSGGHLGTPSKDAGRLPMTR